MAQNLVFRNVIISNDNLDRYSRNTNSDFTNDIHLGTPLSANQEYFVALEKISYINKFLGEERRLTGKKDRVQPYHTVHHSAEGAQGDSSYLIYESYGTFNDDEALISRMKVTIPSQHCSYHAPQARDNLLELLNTPTPHYQACEKDGTVNLGAGWRSDNDPFFQRQLIVWGYDEQDGSFTLSPQATTWDLQWKGVGVNSTATSEIEKIIVYAKLTHSLARMLGVEDPRTTPNNIGSGGHTDLIEISTLVSENVAATRLRHESAFHKIHAPHAINSLRVDLPGTVEGTLFGGNDIVPLLQWVPVDTSLPVGTYTEYTSTRLQWKKVLSAQGLKKVRARIYGPGGGLICFDKSAPPVILSLVFSPVQYLDVEQSNVHVTKNTLILRSDRDLDSFPRNQPYDFTNSIDPPIPIDRLGKQISLHQLQTNKNWYVYRLPTDSLFRIQYHRQGDVHTKLYTVHMVLPEGTKIRGAEQLVDALNAAYERAEDHMEGLITFKYDKIKDRIFIQCDKVSDVIAVNLVCRHATSNELSSFFDALGWSVKMRRTAFNRNYKIQLSQWVGPHPDGPTTRLYSDESPETMNYIYKMYVTANGTVRDTSVGDRDIALISDVPLNPHDTRDYLTYTEERQRLFPIATDLISKIRIRLVDDEGLCFAKDPLNTVIPTTVVLTIQDNVF